MITDSTYHSTWMISRYPTAIQIGIRQYKYCRKIHPEQRLQVLHKRTSMLHFTKLSIPPPIELRLVNIRIQKSETAKDLGLVFDSELDWNAHIQQLKSKCNKALNLI